MHFSCVMLCDFVMLCVPVNAIVSWRQSFRGCYLGHHGSACRLGVLYNGSPCLPSVITTSDMALRTAVLFAIVLFTLRWICSATSAPRVLSLTWNAVYCSFDSECRACPIIIKQSQLSSINCI